MRQLVVWALNPRGRGIEVGILTDDFKRPAQQIIVLRFKRWLQENDFKYLEVHFGINQITSYASVAYEKLTSQLEEKQVRSREWTDNYADLLRHVPGLNAVVRIKLNGDGEEP